MRVVAQRFHQRITPALAVVAVVACAGRTDRPVLVSAEDGDPVRGGTSCRVVEHSVLARGVEVAAPALASTREDEVFVAWVARETSSRWIALRHLTPALELDGPERALGHDEEGMPIAPAVTACGGTVWVAWQRQEPRGGDSIRLAVLTSGDLETGEAVTAGRGTDPAIACLDETAALTWTLRHDGVQDVFLAWVDARGRLGEPVRLGGETDVADTPAVACGDRRCGVAWADARDVRSDIYFGSLATGEGLVAPVRISTHDPVASGAGEAYAPAVATTDGLTYLIAWHDTRTVAESQIYTATVAESGAVGPDSRISRAPAPSTAAAVAACEEGNAVAWRDRRDGPPVVLFAAVDRRGRRASPSIALGEEADDASAPAIACGPRSTFAVTWTSARDDGGGLELALLDCR
jgi:hypothetical protein